jgi:hypothetical protein
MVHFYRKTDASLNDICFHPFATSESPFHFFVAGYGYYYVTNNAITEAK